MKTIKHILITLSLLVVISSCNRTDKPEVYKSRHTLIVYIFGDTDSGLKRYLELNISHIKNAVTNTFPSNGRIFILHDKPNTTVLYELVKPSKKGSVAKEVVVKEYEELKVTDPANMAMIISDVKAVNDSRTNEDISEGDYYGIVFSSHGTGWLPYQLNDSSNPRAPKPDGVAGATLENDITPILNRPENSLTRAFGEDREGGGYTVGALMSASEIAEGLSPVKFDYVLFDACFMSSIEVLYEMRKSTKYVVASAAEVLLPGFPYTKVIPTLFSKENKTIPAKLVAVSDVFYNHYNAYQHPSATVAVIDMEKIDGLVEPAKAIYSGDENPEFNLGNIQVYESLNHNVFFDLKDYFGEMSTSDVDKDKFINALNETVIAERHTKRVYSMYGGWFNVDKSCGITTYIPRDQFPVTRDTWLETSWAKAISAE